MSNVIDMQKWKLEKATEKSVKQYFRDSLDNEKVKKNYNLVEKKEITADERYKRISDSIKRINGLMAELNDTNKKG
jgi:hypothetical protein